MNKSIVVTCMLVALSLLGAACQQNPERAADEARGIEFTVTLDRTVAEEAQDGRLLLMLSTHLEKEPRFLVGVSADTQLIFGLNVEDWAAGSARIIDGTAIGFPLDDLSQVPPGTYFAQALLNRYQDFHLSNGKVVSLPPDRGEGQQWNRKPGNLYSKPVKITIGEAGTGRYDLVLDQDIAEIEPPRDTEFVKHVRMRSELLSEFWGTDIYLGAHVLLPAGFDDHPEARYPLMIFHGHFPADFGGFRTEPPDPDLEPDYSSASEASAKAGRASSTAVRPAAGKPWPCRSSTPRNTTGHSSPARTRSIFEPT